MLSAFFTALFDLTLRFIFSQPWYIAVGLSLLLGFGLTAWQILRPDIIQKTVAAIQKARSGKAKAKQFLRTLPRIVLGLVVASAMIGVSLVFLYGLYMQTLSTRLTKTQRTCLIMAYLAYRENQLRESKHSPCNMVIMGALAEQMKYLWTLPKERMEILMTIGKETLTSANLLKDTAYRELINPMTGEKSARNTEMEIAPLGIRVVEFLVKRDPTLPLRLEAP